jgi:hypothetical protein
MEKASKAANAYRPPGKRCCAKSIGRGKKLRFNRLGQYRRNRPTSLPWMRTRLGGRMRTS